MDTIEIVDLGQLLWESNNQRNNQFGCISSILELKLQTTTQTFDLLSLVPDGNKVEIGYSHPNYSFHDKEIHLGVPNGIEWLTSSLHEIGHANDSEKPEYNGKKHDYAYLAYGFYNRDTTPQHLLFVLNHEISAWNFAFSELLRMEAPITILEQAFAIAAHDRRLYSYVRNMIAPSRLEMAAKNGNISQEELRGQILRVYDTFYRQFNSLTNQNI